MARELGMCADAGPGLGMGKTERNSKLFQPSAANLDCACLLYSFWITKNQFLNKRWFHKSILSRYFFVVTAKKKKNSLVVS
jgi:hypothetical protein